ncbi:MAG: SsrA-binding protein SmpB [Dehalococcoidia bacterium]|nr:SsrA-binding protein SmpB [Dehalococcoidia bacterium]MDP6783525.1 SsrA-binding protein SmpB [Dehalococcoidia bacterium]
MSKAKGSVAPGTVSVNRKAFHDYLILEKAVAGLVLTGTEVKSLREGRISIREAYVRPQDDELWLVGAHIPPYSAGGPYNHDPTRSRKLLLQRKEIDRLTDITTPKGRTLVPLRVFFRRGWAKLEIGVGQGKRQYDKRQTIKDRDTAREIDRAVKGHSGRR